MCVCVCVCVFGIFIYKDDTLNGAYHQFLVYAINNSSH